MRGLIASRPDPTRPDPRDLDIFLIRPAGRAMTREEHWIFQGFFAGHGVFKMSRIGLGRVKRFSNLAGRVRSDEEFFKSHGSGRVKKFRNLTGRVRSDQEVMQISRVGSGHEPARNGSLAGRVSTTRESCFADPRVGPAHPARGPDT